MAPIGEELPFVGHIVLDVPAAKPTLRFDQIARALATIVETSPPRFAVGIFGGWGSGKSTLMDEIQRLLVGDETIVVQFNAWRFEREPHLIVPLLDTIRSSLSNWAVGRDDKESADKVREIAGRVGRVVRALVRATSLDFGLPGSMSISVDPGKALDEMTAHPGDPASAPQSLYFGAFEELNGAFGQVSDAGVQRIVVMVDDLDRCLPQQALTVLESMKLFFDMPGFVFVVGLDEHVVESAVRTKFNAAAEPAAAQDVSRTVQLERDYLKKIFQVPYTLPAMVEGQLGELLEWLYSYGELTDEQKDDLRARVARYLGHVAINGRLNPREVKRFINAYTLSRMIRPDLDADTLLALGTLDFRADWELQYESIVLAEPDIFSEALQRFVQGDSNAFEDLWPDVGVLPLELSSFLRSPEAAPLQRPDLASYVTFLETTRSPQAWLSDAMRDVGTLRAQLRRVTDDLAFGGDQAREVSATILDALSRLGTYQSMSPGLTAPLDRLRSLAAELSPAPSSPEVAAAAVARSVESWRRDVAAQVDAVQQELRLLRGGSKFAS